MKLDTILPRFLRFLAQTDYCRTVDPTVSTQGGVAIKVSPLRCK